MFVFTLFSMFSSPTLDDLLLTQPKCQNVKQCSSPSSLRALSSTQLGISVLGVTTSVILLIPSSNKAL